MRASTPRLAVAVAFTTLILPTALAASPRPPAVLMVVVDTLRSDHLSINGYQRPTSPAIDALLERGAHLVDAHTVEPLTAPAMASALTGLPPHQHGAARNGLRLRPGLSSLPKTLAEHGWHTGAFVGNWTLRDKLTGLGEHFEHYEEVLTRRRWFGILNAESTAEDVTDAALAWLEATRREHPGHPVFMWVHYVEPHAPYRMHRRYAHRLGVDSGRTSRRDRYDTEIAAVDDEVGRLVHAVEKSFSGSPPLVVFLADHGESLGEHNEWGHGRNLFEPGLRIPMGVIWNGHIPAATVPGPATILDIAPTLAGLIDGIDFRSEKGRDWSTMIRQGRDLPADRSFCVQAHKGAVKGDHESEQARSKGLLAIAFVSHGRKEILTMGRDAVELFDLSEDPRELTNLKPEGSPPSTELMTCVGEIMTDLGRLDRMATRKLSADTIEQLKALGYLN